MVSEEIGIVVVSRTETREAEMYVKALERWQALCCYPVIVVEHGGYDHRLPSIRWDDDLNYNAMLNAGCRELVSSGCRWLACCNNDLDWGSAKPIRWPERLIEHMGDDYDSISPACPDSHFAYRGMTPGSCMGGWAVGKLFAGWCYLLTTDAYLSIGGFDETYTFFCSDNAVADQLSKQGYSHLWDGSVTVRHIGGRSQGLLDADDLVTHTSGQVKRYNA